MSISQNWPRYGGPTASAPTSAPLAGCQCDRKPADRAPRAIASARLGRQGDRERAAGRTPGRSRVRGWGAAMDRLLHNAHVVVMNGDTYRNPPPAKKARRGNGRSAAG
jgi:hypothetical protein